MKILIKENDMYYRNLVGQEFDVVEKLESLLNSMYFIKGKENEKSGNWFSKKDCIISDEDYLNSLQELNINTRLDYYNNKLTECHKDVIMYERGDYKEAFKGENKILLIGSVCEEQRLEGKIELLKILLGINDIC